MSELAPEDGWRLERASNNDIDELMGWFDTAHSVKFWGGPRFRFPYTRETFHEDCRWRDMATFVVRDPSGQFKAFGQVYERFGRINLARLVANPDVRGQGVGKRLVSMLMDVGKELLPRDEYSLFVYRNNVPALECYKAMGFVVQDYPKGDPMADVCYYLTRAVERS